MVLIPTCFVFHTYEILFTAFVYCTDLFQHGAMSDNTVNYIISGTPFFSFFIIQINKGFTNMYCFIFFSKIKSIIHQETSMILVILYCFFFHFLGSFLEKNKSFGTNYR